MYAVKAGAAGVGDAQIANRVRVTYYEAENTVFIFFDSRIKLIEFLVCISSI